MMGLYKSEKVNPASGCLPMLIQIPVFFSLYKVIFVTIEMRQAPFFGWIRDLSAPDPTNLFNLFGLIPFDPASASPLLHIGVWPIIMGLTMFFQQRLNPTPPDPMAVPVHADPVHLHAGEVSSRARDLLQLEQSAYDVAAMADHAAEPAGDAGRGTHHLNPGRVPPAGRPGVAAYGRVASRVRRIAHGRTRRVGTCGSP
jgi:hypothetical protein